MPGGPSRLAIVAGGGDDLDTLVKAEALRADTVLTGAWWTAHTGDYADRNRDTLRAALPKIGMNLLGGSHDGTESVVLRNRVAPLLAGWGFDVIVLRQDDHWR